tara:strand:+ start:645 stop:1793 length:1149 start_codon:yes stop_codon:yes gene_type:complete
MKKLNEKQIEFLTLAQKEYGDQITMKQVKDLEAKYGLSDNGWFVSKTYRLSRGVYKVPSINGEVSIPEVKVVEKPKSKISKTSNAAEEITPNNEVTFVPWGHYKDIKSVVKSKIFYPTFITGLSGNGKTLNVLQACSELKRECIRVNVTIETDEDDLLGGFRLVNGETAWHDGPVVDAMKRGAVLLLDEIDLASNKIMCLQPILEGKGVFLKKINEYIEPAKGFNIIATANTKGKGSDDGRFIGTNVLNEAFLERFPITFEQSYPTVKIEQNIVLKVFESLGIKDKEFAENLVKWADVIRKTFYDGGIDEIISTRRLVHIANAYAIFNNKMKAIQVCTNRFDEDTKNSFLDLYTKVDAGEDLSQLNQTEEMVSNDSEENENF